MTTMNYQALSKTRACTQDAIARVVTELEKALDPNQHNDRREEQLSVIDLCEEQLQRVHGVLRLMQFNEAGLLVQEVLSLLKNMNFSSEEQKIDVLQCLYSTLIDLPALIDRQFGGEAETAHAHLNLINKIRKLRGAALVFSCAPLLISESVSFRNLLKRQNAEFNRLFGSQCELYRQAIKNIEDARAKGSDLQAGLDSLIKVFVKLEILNRDFRLGTLWGLCLALAESLDGKELDAESSALDLLCSYQPLLDKILQTGRRTLDQNIPEQDLERIFDELGRTEAGSASDRLFQVKCWFNLDMALNRENRQRYSHLQASYLQQEAGMKAVEILLDDIRRLSEMINQTNKDGSCDQNIFRQIISDFEVLTHTATTLKVEPVREILTGAITRCRQSLNDYEHAAGSNNADFYTAVLEHCVQYLYRSELWLQAWIRRRPEAGTGADRHDGKVADATVPVDMFSDSRNKFAREVLKDLEGLFINLNDYVDAGCRPAHLLKPIGKLGEISAALFMMQEEKAAGLAAVITDRLQTVSQSAVSPDPATGTEFFSLAEALVQLATYLELLVEGWHDEARLQHMEAKMAGLDGFFSSTFPTAPQEEQTAGAINGSEPVRDTPAEHNTRQESEQEVDEEIAREIRMTFIEESAQIIDELLSLHETLNLEPGNQQALADCRRCFHTLKGSGRVAGATVIADAAWTIEDALNNLISTSESPDGNLLGTIADFIESLPTMMEKFRQGRDSDAELDALRDKAGEAEALTGEIDHEQPDDRSGSAFAMFVHEAEKQCNCISQLLEQASDCTESDSEVIADDFLIPVHTLAGSGKVAGLHDYAALLKPLEKLLESHPRLVLSANMAAVFSSLTELTSKLLDNLSSQTQQDGRIVSAFAEPYQQALVDLNLELSATGDQSVADDQQTELAQNPTLAAFLREAGQLMAQVCRKTSMLDTASDCWNLLGELCRQLVILEGAAKVAGQEELSRFSRVLWGIYSLLQEKPAVLNDEILAVLHSSHDYLDQSLLTLSQGGQPADPDMLIERLEEAVNHKITRTAEREIETVLEGEEDEKDEEEGNAETNEQKAPVEKSEETQKLLTGEDEALLLTFLEEAEELLQELESSVSEWRDGKENAEADQADDILRILHTLKGSAALVGETAMSEQSHQFESFLIESRQQGQAQGKDFFSRAEARVKVLQLLYALYHRDQDGSLVRDEISQAEIESILGNAQSAEQNTENKKQEPAPVKQAPAIPREGSQTVNAGEDRIDTQTAPPDEESPGKAAAPKTRNRELKQTAVQDENVRVSGRLLKSLLNDVYEINISHNRMESGIGELITQLNEIEATTERLQNYMKTIEEQARTAQQGSIVSSRTHEDFDALEMESYSEMQQIAHSLREDYEDLQEIKSNLINRIRDVDSILHEQQSSTNNLQQGLISSQMIPFASLFPRLRRLTHQISQTLDKDVSLVFSNTEDRLDRGVIQVLTNPLEHMIRNAVDHGIETPAERQRKGKSQQAEIHISLYRQGASILLDVSDDGAGIDVDKVRRKAVAAGLMQEGDQVSQNELLQFLLSAGFSTSESLSSISGRGVGLDVVAREVSQIGGDIEILSEQGRGTTFRIHLPMTSALHRCLQFTLSGEQYVVLLNNVDAILREPVDKLRQGYTGRQGGKLEYAGKNYELCYLGSLLDERCKPEFDPLQQSAPLLLVSGEKRNLALQVDSIIKSNDLIVRSLGTQFSAIPGLGGGVILGDGQIVLVLDPVSIVNAYSKQGRSLFQGFFNLEADEDGKVSEKTVLVVDDSLTVRKVTSMILERHGIKVLLAKNGLEAVEILKQTRPDVVLLDIEMPKMDGFEVASFIRQDQGRLKDLPIIMITSRVGEKHRNRAAEIGVNQYMCKPFQEENLLEAIAVYH